MPILEDTHSARSVTEALKRVPDEPVKLNRKKNDVSGAIHRLANATEAEDHFILDCVHLRVRKVLVAYGVNPSLSAVFSFAPLLSTSCSGRTKPWVSFHSFTMSS